MRMRGYSMLENREISSVSSSYTKKERSGKVCGHNPGMFADEKSDINIVPKKAPNNVAQATAEALEGRTMTKGNSGKGCLRPARRGRGKH